MYAVGRSDPASVTEERSGEWNAITRIALRFSVVYFSAYVLCTQMLAGLILLPGPDVPELGSLTPLRQIVSWTAAHVFGVRQALVITGSGSGDKTFDWVEAFVFLVVAIAATAVWSALDRRRRHDVTAAGWFRVFLRFALGSTILQYAADKIVPVQMPAPSLARLVEPYGNFSPMGVLWAAVGASRPYEMFTGFAELAAAVLLFIPGQTVLGGLILLADATYIFALNMTYDVPVKLFSFHLIVMSLVLLAPDASRLANVLVLNRGAGPPTEPLLARSRRARRAIVALQLVFGAYLVGLNLYNSRTHWYEYGGGAPHSPLYGLWNVEEMSIDGHVRSPLITDNGRWRRAIFQSPTVATFQRMDDTFVTYKSGVDLDVRTLTLREPSNDSPAGTLAVQRPDPQQLVLDGYLDGHKVRMELRRIDRNTFLLVSRGFHWVQEYPLNR